MSSLLVAQYTMSIFNTTYIVSQRSFNTLSGTAFSLDYLEQTLDAKRFSHNLYLKVPELLTDNSVDYTSERSSNVNRVINYHALFVFQ
ncbi:hypothetical protein RIR_jg28843.t1 [Rhizophagus irregularis DAOM 181602=DAOM 197198]|nr:hypothetical protein RIR_jg28843.t1 [Rhizophagus irregularis DAOM 181602=DAOM 197198]